MPMKQDFDTGNFQRWPYIPERRDDGDHNNGAIDLVADPDRIGEIHEATDANGLRPLLIELNSATGQFMTLGCASGIDGDDYLSYLELTYRDQSRARDLEEIHALNDAWERWVRSKYPDYAEPILASVVLAYRSFSLRRSEPQHLITVYHRATEESTHRQLLDLFHLFLRDFQELQAFDPPA
ncbi:hypothetical protein [Pseudomonas sp. JV245A]|uniref:hypothetical protein n=1 Tax=Pseudomonas sp. JV245A TaxID=1890668 RepID=UPI0028E11F71|nr:hypothetical protein [Pseudomonas sp. JV245A]MDT9643116.1 hypothetical protein [Pseudomonas sp. JV245A]